MSDPTVVGPTPVKTAPKPGVKSTEFWATMVMKVLFAALIFTNKMDATTGAALIGGSGAMYMTGRTMAKVKS